MNCPVVRSNPHPPCLVISKDLFVSLSDGETCSFALQMTCDEAREVARLLNQLAFEREDLATCECAGQA